jgi:hypothetical protein
VPVPRTRSIPVDRTQRSKSVEPARAGSTDFSLGFKFQASAIFVFCPTLQRRSSWTLARRGMDVHNNSQLFTMDENLSAGWKIPRMEPRVHDLVMNEPLKFSPFSNGILTLLWHFILFDECQHTRLTFVLSSESASNQPRCPNCVIGTSIYLHTPYFHAKTGSCKKKHQIDPRRSSPICCRALGP